VGSSFHPLPALQCLQRGSSASWMINERDRGQQNGGEEQNTGQEKIERHKGVQKIGGGGALPEKNGSILAGNRSLKRDHEKIPRDQ